ncbi:MAG TPA: sigma-70 family RNA polymerase sigma factor [Shinella sp.]|jgi:RNA polymerase sigma-70 factor (ECF subfamily)|uniref:sigma-70 family RNA polymerase sigma factor n=1 Tax=Shinella sp. TaxID=1870904 RepID=UPI0029B640BF|nr:sigma-70 family RNA polymerase sigma factor [Shinella sp.]MDX3975134.1 sigma-70 family RNA polymerase sigma factor [Shinella sp.]HEV7249516.1 sigma-70 family RNA polymerase sigma factor [Shinella sp.]
MYDASNEIDTQERPAPSTGRRRAVVNAADPRAPTPEALASLLAAVADDRDRQAFAALFRHFGPRLKTFFLRSAISSGVAEDLVQETMLNVWRKASYFDPERAGVATWIFTIARNLRIDHLRRLRNPATLPVDGDDAPPSIEDGVLGAERDERVRRALTTLSAEQQTIIRLSYFSEKSQTEIAGELGIPLGTVKSRTRLAMNRLRALLEDET